MADQHLVGAGRVGEAENSFLHLRPDIARGSGRIVGAGLEAAGGDEPRAGHAGLAIAVAVEDGDSSLVAERAGEDRIFLDITDGFGRVASCGKSGHLHRLLDLLAGLCHVIGLETQHLGDGGLRRIRAPSRRHRPARHR